MNIQLIHPELKELSKFVRGNAEALTAFNESDEEVGVITFGELDDTQTDYPGHYIYMLWVIDRNEGVGHALVKAWIEEQLSRGNTRLYLVRPVEDGRTFQGGFGFELVTQDFTSPLYVRNRGLFCADPPDPNWTP